MQRATKLPGGTQWIGNRSRPTKSVPLCPYLRHSFALAGRDICRSFRKLAVVSF
jgi:hypothetical protein